MNEEELKQRIVAHLHFLKGFFLLRGKFPEKKIEQGFSLMADNLMSEFLIMPKITHVRQWPVKDKTKYCDKCGFMGTYGDGKTWNRCFTHLNDEPKPKVHA